MELTLYPGENGFLRMRRLVRALEEVLGKAPFKVVHVAGTSGKGSTAMMIARLLKGAGYKVGLFLSPYLIKPEEQIQVNERLISMREDRSLKEVIKKLAAHSVVPEFGLYSDFEKLVARALVYFMKKHADVAVLETGMGGLYDATNAVESDISVITPISYDHDRLLGPGIEDIARHKAGIIKSGNHAVVIGRQEPGVGVILREAARAKGVPPLFLGTDFTVDNVHISETGTAFDYHHGALHLQNLHIPLIGAHQADNAALAITAVNVGRRESLAVSRKKHLDNIAFALSKVHNPGRFEILKHKNKKIIMDVAHNPEKIAAVVRTFQSLWPQKKAVIVFSCKWTKDVRLMAQQLKTISDTVMLTQFTHYPPTLINRVMEKPQLINAFQEAGFAQIQWVQDPFKALQQAISLSTEFILITGSFYLLRNIKTSP